MKKLSTMVLVVSLFLSTFSLARAEDGWLSATLRTDLSALRTAQDYITFTRPQQLPDKWMHVSDGYLKIYPSTGGFIEVGIGLQRPDFLGGISGRGWYVLSQGYNIECLRGFRSNVNTFCSAARTDSLTNVDAEYRLELVTYGGGFWIARVQNMSTLEIYDVAKIFSTTTVVNNVFVSMWLKEGSDPPPNKAIFRHRDPSYMVWGSGFQLWPLSSGGNNNTLAAVSLVGCPQYYKGASVGTRTWLVGNLAAGSCNLNPLF